MQYIKITIFFLCILPKVDYTRSVAFINATFFILTIFGSHPKCLRSKITCNFGKITHRSEFQHWDPDVSEKGCYLAFALDLGCLLILLEKEFNFMVVDMTGVLLRPRAYLSGVS